ncbi:MAG: hypothetical protein ACLFQV_06925 [Vulcanimicrobiota bacterium]
MIVIAIISILASIIIPNISRARARAQLTSCMGNLKALVTTGEMYVIDHPIPMGEHWSYRSEDPSSFDGPAPFFPGYIAQNPVCPAVGESMYVVGLSGGENKGTSAYCDGSFHETVTGTSCYPCYLNYWNSYESMTMDGYVNVGGDTNYYNW